MPAPFVPKWQPNFLGFGKHFAKNNAPVAATWGLAGGLLLVFFTDNWLGKYGLQHIPVLGNRYAKNIAAAAEEE